MRWITCHRIRGRFISLRIIIVHQHMVQDRFLRLIFLSSIVDLTLRHTLTCHLRHRRHVILYQWRQQPHFTWHPLLHLSAHRHRHRQDLYLHRIIMLPNNILRWQQRILGIIIHHNKHRMELSSMVIRNKIFIEEKKIMIVSLSFLFKKNIRRSIDIRLEQKHTKTRQLLVVAGRPSAS